MRVRGDLFERRLKAKCKKQKGNPYLCQEFDIMNFRTGHTAGIWSEHNTSNDNTCSDTHGKKPLLKMKI